MENILYNISQVLGITIIHSLWQGLLIYFILRFVLLCTNWLPSSKKYTIALTALLAVTAWFGYTLITQIQLYDWLARPTNLTNMPMMLELPGNIRQFNEQTIRYYYNIEKYLPYIAVAYVAGLLLHATRLILARRKMAFIKQTMSIDVPLQQQISKFAEVLNITKKVKVSLSKMVDVPCITGYFKPVILLPFTLATCLSPDEIEAILMHELAHIKRNDYLVNLLQQVITTLLFFNPCVLLINKIIGEERENCCDDIVVDNTQTPVITYAKALFKLEQTRQNHLQLALAVTGKKYHLLNRIERIMKTKKQVPSVRPTLVAMLILTLSVCGLALLNPKIAEGKISVKAFAPTLKGLLTDTIPAKAAKTKTIRATAKNKTVYKSKTATDKATRFSYNSNNNSNKNWNFSYNDGLKDPELERLGKEVEKYGNAIGKYYESDDFKAKSAEMEKLGKEMEAFYNSDRIKQITAAQEKTAAEYDKLMRGKGANMEQNGKQMEALGKSIEKYYNSAEFKSLNEKLEKKYGVSHEGYHDSSDPNYKKYQDELKTYIPETVKKQTRQIKEMGEQMRSVYNSDSFRAQGDKMRAMGDSIRRAFNNPQIKQQQERMRQLGQEMRAFTQNDEIKRQQKQLHEATAKMRAYMNTPEFKKKLAEYKKTHPDRHWYWNDDDNDKVERPEAPEKPEQPEKPEAPENN